MTYLQHIGLAAGTVLWGLVVLISFVGWGRKLLRTLKLADNSWPLQATFGLALLISIGGLLNLLFLARPAIVLLLIALGFFWGARSMLEETKKIFRAATSTLTSREATPILRVLTLATLLFVALRLLGEARPWSHNFQHHDDFQAYLTHPLRMLQTGTFGPEPFNARRLSSLGGQAFLQTTMAVALPLNSVRFADSGICLLIVLGLALSYARRFKLNLSQQAFVLFAIAALPPPAVNTTTMLVGTCLFFSLTLTLEKLGGAENPAEGRRAIAAVSILAAAILASKSTLGLCAVILILGFFIWKIWRGNVFVAIGEALALGGIITILLLPWMILSYRSSGTLFFPYFGRGFEASSYSGSLAPVTFEMFARDVLVAFRFGWFWPLLLTFFAPGNILKRPIFGALIVGTFASYIAVISGLQWFPFDHFRYIYPSLYVIFILGLIHALGTKLAQRNVWVAGLIAAIWFGPFWMSPVGWLRTYYIYAKTLTFGHRDCALFTNEEKQSILNAQNAIPVGSPVLCKVELPFLLRFDRNQIDLIDIPGSSSPPPGIPLQSDAEAVAQYLEMQGIRYVMYSYWNGAGFDPRDLKTRLEPGVPKWYGTVAKASLNFRSKLAQLGSTRRHLYDDGKIWVIDLTQSAN